MILAYVPKHANDNITIFGGRPSGCLHACVSSVVKTRSIKEAGDLEPALPQLADKANMGDTDCCSSQCAVSMLLLYWNPTHLDTPLYNVAKYQHKENWWQMDWTLIFASSRLGIMQSVSECFSSPRLMRSPWEFVNRHRR
jgi:hypothetical protein